MATRPRRRNETMIWLLETIGWTRIDMPTEMVAAAGHDVTGYEAPDRLTLGNFHSTLQKVFLNNDRGIAEMQSWCDTQCRKPWRYEPGCTFLFRSKKDAAIFKLTWWR
jgi:hypothetical protein